MTLYLDTSLLVAALTNEPTTARMQEWLNEHLAESLAISAWVVTEFSSALSIKLRSDKQFLAEHRANALAAFRQLETDSLLVLPVTPIQFRNAAQFADHYQLGLRAGDALHLAVCADHGATLCTLDKRLEAAGLALGIKTTLIK